MEKEIISNLIKGCESEIIKAKIFINFYKKQELKQSKEVAGKTKLKRMQLEDTVTANSEMLEYFKSL